MNFEERIRECLGPVPNIEARLLLPGLQSATQVILRYEWIKNWSAVADLDFHDGEEWITFLKPDSNKENMT